MTQEEKQHLLKIDICGRLPYGVKYYDVGFDDIQQIEAYTSDDYAEWASDEIGGFFAIGRKIILGSDMPILRPIEDLCCEITHAGYNDGKPFYPAVKLANIGITFPPDQEFTPNQGSYTSNGGVKYYTYGCDSDWYQFAYHIDMRGFVIINKDSLESYHVKNQPMLFDLMNRLMIDYRGLIPAGLAKSVHDLDKNPYE